jgi:hypothetical protein
MDWSDYIRQAAAERGLRESGLLAEVERLREALRPFADRDCSRCDGAGRYSGRVLGDFMADGPCEVCNGTGAAYPDARAAFNAR